MSSHPNQPRQPKGVPVGGQWREMVRPEGTVALRPDPRPEQPDLWHGWEDGDRPRRLTGPERDLVRAWRAVASHYRHGDCGRESHVPAPGCDIVCLTAHGRPPAGPGRDEVVELTTRPPWTRCSDRRTTAEDNAVVGLMCRLVMHAVPRSS